MIPAGEFRHRVSCQAPSEAQDDMGGAGGDYAEEFKVRAKVEYAVPAGQEQQGAGNLAGLEKVKVIIRANAETRRISSRWRLVWRGQNWHVRAVANGPVGRRGIDLAGAAATAYLTIDAEAGVAA